MVPHRVRCSCVLDQAPAHTLAMVDRVDEERVNMAVGERHEAAMGGS